METSMTNQRFDVKIAADGRMLLPAAVRAALGINGATHVILVLEEGRARIEPIATRIATARELFARHFPASYTVDTFLADRDRKT
jgi:bifunctional DNA-binding transcriptional regulator/antitoxin component of YhaV-PrlF toxin-antitoxin module